MYSDFFLEFYLNVKSCVNKSCYRTVNFLLSLKMQTTQSVACQQPRNTSSAADRTSSRAVNRQNRNVTQHCMLFIHARSCKFEKLQ